MSIVLRLCSERVRLRLSAELETKVKKFYHPCLETGWTGEVVATVVIKAGQFECDEVALPDYLSVLPPSLLRLEKMLLALCDELHSSHCVLHAAGVVLDGKLVVFLGKANSGKSSLCCEAILNGASYLSDDELAIAHGKVWGLARSIRFNEVQVSQLNDKPYLQKMNTELYRGPKMNGRTVLPFYEGEHRTLASVSTTGTPVIVVKLEQGKNHLQAITEFEALAHLHESAILCGQEYPGGLQIESAYCLSWQDPQESWRLLESKILALTS